MAPIFKILRRKLVQEGKVGRYLAYALGEIILIILGILIALHLNNKQTALTKRKDINRYYLTILNELKANKDLIETHYLTYATYKIDVSRQILAILNSDNYDSLEKNKELLYALISQNPGSSISPPFISLEEFRNKYLTEIQDDSLKSLTLATLDGQQKFHNTLISTEKDLVFKTIIPFLDKSINSTEIIFPASDKEYILKGGPKSNYNKLFNNLEFYNMVNHYLEFSSFNKNFFERWVNYLDKFIQYLEKLIEEIKG